MQIQPHHINRLEERYTQRELANVFEVNERTIRRLKKPKPTPKKRGRKPKMDENDLDFLRLHIDTVGITNQTTNQKALSRYFSCSQSTICRTLKRAGIAYKKATHQSTEQLRKKNKAKIEEFINITLPSLLRSNANIFFLDECSFHLNMAPRRGYCSKGSRLVRQRPGNKGKNQTLILLAQITNGEKIIHRKLIEGGMKTKEFHEFISEFNPPNNGKRNVLIMDNLSVHKAMKSCQKLGLSTIEELAKSKGIEIIFLPPYTPELNPIERCFNIIRQYVENCQARSKEKLKLAIEEKIKFFQGEDMTKYLESSVRECLMKLASFPQIESADYSCQPKEDCNISYSRYNLGITIAHEMDHIKMSYRY